MLELGVHQWLTRAELERFLVRMYFRGIGFLKFLPPAKVCCNVWLISGVP